MPRKVVKVLKYRRRLPHRPRRVPIRGIRSRLTRSRAIPTRRRSYRRR